MEPSQKPPHENVYAAQKANTRAGNVNEADSKIGVMMVTTNSARPVVLFISTIFQVPAVHGRGDKLSKYSNFVSDDIREDILEYIYKNSLKPGDALPGERAMCEMFSCSRASLRRALAQLSGEDVVFTVPGSGTFLAPHKFVEESSNFISFSTSWQMSGHRVTSRQLSFSEVDANLKVSRMLGVPLGTKVFELKRLRLIDEVLISIETSYIEKAKCPTLMSFRFDGMASLYAVLRDRFNLDITHLQQNIRTTKIRNDEAELLCVEKGTSAFYVSAIGLTDNDEVIEYSLTVSRADRYAVHYSATAK